MFQSWRQLMPLVIAGLLMWGLIIGALTVACGGTVDDDLTMTDGTWSTTDTILLPDAEIIWPEDWECARIPTEPLTKSIGAGRTPRFIEVCGPVVEREQ